MSSQLWRSLLMASVVLWLVVPPAWAEEIGKGAKGEKGDREWLAQSPIQVTGVRLNPTDTGIEVVLETAQGEALKPTAIALGKSYIANIPNAVLALPQGQEFRGDNPVSGITRVSVTVTATNSIRVTVTGATSVPAIKLYDSPEEGLIFAVASSASSTQQGQQSQEPSSQTDEPIEILVTGEQEETGYSVPNASTATKTDTPLRDIPQSIQVVPKQVLEDRQPTNLVDALRSVPGISQARQASTSIYEDPVIRGFAASEFDVLRNGLTTPYATISSFDSATVERIEVLRGPASVLFGQGSLGGIINVIIPI